MRSQQDHQAASCKSEKPHPFDLYAHLTKLMLLLLEMGCIAVEKKREETLSPSDYRLIWSKCLRLEAVQIHSKATSFHPVFVQIDKDVDRTYPDVP